MVKVTMELSQHFGTIPYVPGLSNGAIDFKHVTMTVNFDLLL